MSEQLKYRVTVERGYKPPVVGYVPEAFNLTSALESIILSVDAVQTEDSDVIVIPAHDVTLLHFEKVRVDA